MAARQVMTPGQFTEDLGRTVLACALANENKEKLDSREHWTATDELLRALWSRGFHLVPIPDFNAYSKQTKTGRAA